MGFKAISGNNFVTPTGRALIGKICNPHFHQNKYSDFLWLFNSVLYSKTSMSPLKDILINIRKNDSWKVVESGKKRGLHMRSQMKFVGDIFQIHFLKCII